VPVAVEAEDLGWMRVLSVVQLAQLEEALGGGSPIVTSYFGTSASGWSRLTRETLPHGRYGVDATAAVAVACIEVQKASPEVS
jgi:hypothetical protein